MSEPGSRFRFRPGSRTLAGLAAVKPKYWITVSILCFLNLVHCIDRYSLATTLEKIIIYYDNRVDQSSFVSVVYVIATIVAAPVFGYVGDRYNRKFTLAAATLFWSIASTIASFMTTFYSFTIFRAMANSGKSSYSIICPAIICDMFKNELRCDMLALFYFMLPVGTGLGLLLGSEMFKVFGVWQWNHRLMSLCGIFSALLVLFAMHEPVRGEADFPNGSPRATTWTVDFKALFQNYSFLLATAGFTCASFVASAFLRWYPFYLYMGCLRRQKSDEISFKTITKQFETVLIISEVVGLPVGLIFATKLRQIYPLVDPLVCGTALVLTTPIMYLALVAADSMSPIWSYSLIFFVFTALNTSWLVVSDMNLYIIIPTRRATAAAIQDLISQLLGNVLGPYFLTAFWDLMRKYVVPPKSGMDFLSLQYALYSICVVHFFGGMFYLFIVKYIVEDNERALSTYSEPSVARSSTNL